MMEITNLKRDNIPTVVELLAQGQPFVLPHHKYVYWIMEEYFPSSNYVLSIENKIIGFICALPSIDKQCYFIWQLVVDVDYKGKGVATLLVNRIIEEAKLRAMNKLEFSISSSNNASYKLFERIANEHHSHLKTIDELKDWNEIVYSIALSK